MAGAKVLSSSQDTTIQETIDELFPAPQSILSYTDAVSSTVSLSQINSGHDLNDLELTVLKGELGVAENGAIWVQIDDLEHRSSLFICQHLVILLKKSTIVHHLHEAYDRINFEGSDYGLFISGPSKTADIEQALVIGAHGPRSCTVIVEG